MPFTLTTPVSQSITINAYEINSFSVDIDAQTIHIAYDEGTLSNGVFTPVTQDKMLSVSGQSFIDAITAFETAAGPSKYADLKTALYAQLVAANGLVGTVV